MSHGTLYHPFASRIRRKKSSLTVASSSTSGLSPTAWFPTWKAGLRSDGSTSLYRSRRRWLQVQRAWQSVWALASTPYEASFTEHRVGAQDLPEAFDVIISLLQATDTNLASFAPFGPKPISAAMCLYSILTGSPVYYAQPKTYRPDYSLGIAKSRGEDQIFAYRIRHGAKSLFDVPVNRRAL